MRNKSGSVEAMLIPAIIMSLVIFGAVMRESGHPDFQFKTIDTCDNCVKNGPIPEDVLYDKE